MYVSRLTFLTVPGKTGELEDELKTLRDIVKQAAARILEYCVLILPHRTRPMWCSSRMRLN